VKWFASGYSEAMRLNYQKILTSVCDKINQESNRGKVADYIPALGRIDPKKLGASMVTLEGEAFNYGDSQETFSIQSISKVISLTLAMNQVSEDLWRRVSHEPSGNAFNSIVQLEKEQGIPRNPLINAGALVLADILLQQKSLEACIQSFTDFLFEVSGQDNIRIDHEVAQSELDTSHRNASLAHFMKSFNNLHQPVEDVLKAYCHFCAVAMSCEQMSRVFLYLANNGCSPRSGTCVVSERRARRINSIMMLCGHYDASGDFAFRVGLPGKSGVGGGVVSIIPDVGVMTVWSPGLNSNGNSLLGTAVLEGVIAETGWNIF
jgi:glutaminase